MPNNWFRFKQFTIQQAHSAMKVGTDGVLLGAWASVPLPGSRVLDIGTGTGLIALMIAQRTKHVQIDALEMEASSARQAAENFRNSPWDHRLHGIDSSLQEYAPRCNKAYDLIICNPPFFSASYKTPSGPRNLARHDDSLNLEDLFSLSVQLMKKTGTFSLILPLQKESQTMELIKGHHMYPTRITRVRPAPGKAFKRFLIESSFVPGRTGVKQVPYPSKVQEEELCIETGTRHCYSAAFNSLVDPFYL